jgi:hypothetical protein
LFDVVAHFAAVYRKDFYLQLLIAFFREDWRLAHELTHPLVLSIEANSVLFEDAVLVFCESDLSGMISFDGDHFLAILNQILRQLGRTVSPVLPRFVRSVILSIDENSRVWIDLTQFLLDSGLALDADVHPALDNFVFFGPDEMRQSRLSAFRFAIDTNQFTDYARYLSLARARGLVECEFLLISRAKNPDQLLRFLVANRVTQYRGHLCNVISDPLALKHFLEVYSRTLMALNPQEFVDILFGLNDIPFIHEIGRALMGNPALSWHYLSRLFAQPSFHEFATPEEVQLYLERLCDYRPAAVFPALKVLKTHVDILDLCQDRGIVDATLYLCDLTQDLDRARRFGSMALEADLMAGADSNMVSEICAFLSSRKGKTELWFHFLQAFQLPIFAFLDRPEALASVMQKLEEFIDAMIRNADSPTGVANQFGEMFGFLPLKHGRPLLKRFFSSLTEKNAFAKSLAEIRKEEAVEAQMGRIRALTSGVECDATKCQECGRPFRQGPVIMGSCGHVFHEECARAGKCRTCNVCLPPPRPREPRREVAWRGEPREEDVVLPVSLAAPRIGNVKRLK